MKRRVGVIVTEVGIPSEIWVLRQCLGFRELEPVLIGWRRAADALPIPPGIETRFFPERPKPRWKLLRRIAGRLGAAWPLLPDNAERSEIREVLRAAELDVILCHFGWNAVPVLAALEGADPPVVVHVHGRDVTAHLRYPAYRAALRLTLPRAAALVAVGRHQFDALRPVFLPARHELIPCGAPLDEFASRSIPERRPGEALRFVSVGRLSPEKGLLETLAAIERVAARHPAVEWTCIGNGPLMGTLQEALSQSPIGNGVRLLGWQPAPEVARELSAAHVLLQHSLPAEGSVEGFGVSITEGGAAGLPIIASTLGGIVDQVTHEDNGLLHPPGDVEGQAAAMLRLAENENLRRRMGARAREVAKTFDSAKMIEKLERVLLEAMAASNHPNRRREADAG